MIVADGVKKFVSQMLANDCYLGLYVEATGKALSLMGYADIGVNIVEFEGYAGFDGSGVDTRRLISAFVAPPDEVGELVRVSNTLVPEEFIITIAGTIRGIFVYLDLDGVGVMLMTTPFTNGTINVGVGDVLSVYAEVYMGDGLYMQYA